MDRDGSLPHSQELSTCPYPELDTLSFCSRQDPSNYCHVPRRRVTHKDVDSDWKPDLFASLTTILIYNKSSTVILGHIYPSSFASWYSFQLLGFRSYGRTSLHSF
jgi:hypothetical protein